MPSGYPEASRNPHDFLTDSVACRCLTPCTRKTEGTSMRKSIFAAVALVALVASSVAVAHLKSGDVTAVSATLSATTPSNVQTRTYTCAGQTFEVTTGRWTGLSTSTTPDLNGTADLHVKSVYNVTEEARLGRRQAQDPRSRRPQQRGFLGREHRRQARRLAARQRRSSGRDRSSAASPARSARRVG